MTPTQAYVVDERALLASICRDSFEDFCRELWETVPGAGKVIWNWHMSLLCQEMEAIARRVQAGEQRDYDLVINVPFGTSKSTIVSILFHCWVWTWFPEARFIYGTHTDSLALDLAGKAKDVLESDLYRSLFPEVEIRRDKSSKEDYANTQGGERKSCTVGGKTPTGRHAHFLIVDDPIDPQGVRSEAEIETAAKFMTEVLPSRMTDKAVSTTVLVMQRLHFRDPTAVMLEESRKEGAFPVRHLCLPGELTDDLQPPLEELREKWPEAYAEDGLLDPRRLNRRVLDNYRARGAYFYAGQVLQKPVPPGGGMFKRPWFSKRVKAAPYHARRFRFWDRAATDDGGCYTAGVLVAEYEQNWYVEHVCKGQWEPDERNRMMRAMALRDRAKYGPKHEPGILVEAEGGSSGRDAWKGVARSLAGFWVIEVKVTGSKDARAEPWATQLSAGNVYLVEDGTWDVEDYIQEHERFRPEPGKRLGKWKDQVDASSGVFNYMVGSLQRPNLRSLPLGKRKDNALRIVVLDRGELASTVMDDLRCLLVSLADPPVGEEPPPELPPHAITSLQGSLLLSFAALNPADLQETWQEPIPPWERSPEELILSQDQAKKLWAFLLKKREPPAECFVFQDNGDGKALSIAYAVCDCLRLDRQKTVWLPCDPDGSHKGEPPLNYVYSRVKATRGLVL